MNKALEQDNRFDIEYRIRHQNGRYLNVSDRGGILRDEAGKPVRVIGTTIDISDRKKAEIELQKREELFRTSIENLLDCFGIYTAVRDESGKIIDFCIEYVNAATCASNGMTREEQTGKRLCDLLPGHRTTGLFDEYCQVVETRQPLVKDFFVDENLTTATGVPKAFDIRGVAFGDGFLVTWRDITDRKQVEDELYQIIWNLLSNAVKFTPEGGLVEICLERVENWIQIRIIDTGIGIEAEFLPYMFERFQQADSKTTRSYGGLGLGLAIVRNLVELHGGHIFADSPGSGKGSTFVVQLPCLQDITDGIEEQCLGSSSVECDQSCSELAGLKILVVDDEFDTREFLITALEQYGAEVFAAASTAEAIALIQQMQPEILLSDIGMPGEDGYTLIRQIRTLPPEQGGTIPAAALTAYTRTEDRILALAAGFQMHIPKPIDPRHLIEVVGQLRKK